MRLWFANIQDTPDLPAWQVGEDAAEISQVMSKTFTIGGLAEINEPEDLGAFKKHFQDNLYRFHHPSLPIPTISKTGAFRTIKGGAHRTHDALYDVSGPRYFTYTLYRRRNRPELNPFWHVNTHFISGAFKEETDYTAERRHLWYQHLNQLQSWIDKHRDRDIFVTADTNHPDPPDLGSNQRVLVWRGPDMLAYLPARNIENRNRMRLQRTGVKKLHSDHDLIWADITLDPYA